MRVRHVSLDLEISFPHQRLRGAATLTFERIADAAPLVLDTHRLAIDAVRGADGKDREFALGEHDDLLGQALTVQLAAGDETVRVEYHTRPEARALQWLVPEQTETRRHPFLYTQGQAILTRSWIPLQDSPAVRVTYDATIRAPEELRAVMSAAVREDDGKGVFRFRMDKAIPPYLIALACGELAFKPLGERCGVFASPGLITRAAEDFSDTSKMVEQCEKTFGPYRWGRFDILVLPPAFPYGGMENPTVTFVTPTIIDGTKGSVALIAHELAHSWSGNLVTNATWRDFWLNEGFTVYLEQRIMEVVYGRARAEIEIESAMLQLRKELATLEPRDQCLYLDLAGRDPDVAMTAVAYDKGAAFLRRIEQLYGREALDAFLRDYFATHAFQSMTTERCLAYLDRKLLSRDAEKKKQLDVRAWVHGPGLPETTPKVDAAGLREVDAFREAFLRTGDLPPDAKPGFWVNAQWSYFFDTFPKDADQQRVRRLDQLFGFASNPNAQLRSGFLTIAFRAKMFDFLPQAREFVAGVGRRKLLLPVFEALAATHESLGFAHELFAETQGRLHHITRQSIEKILEAR